MDNHITIAIDGPAGCGKSTVAKELAKRLNIIYLDTGSMYRAVAYTAMKNSVEMSGDCEAFVDMLNNLSMEIKYIDEIPNVFVNGENVSPYLRTKEVSMNASVVAKIPEVRIRMVELQQDIAKTNSVVMDGRDIGTKVLPDSKNKFFMTASVEERTKRRYLEEKDTGISIEEIRADIIKRDENDLTRKVSPLVKADDAIEIDTSSMTVEEVVLEILKRVENNVL